MRESFFDFGVIKSLIRLDRLDVSDPKKKKRKAWVNPLRNIAIAIVSAVLVFFFLTRSKVGLNNNIIDILVWVWGLFFLFTSVQSNLLNLFRKRNDILNRLPIKESDIIAAKTILSFKKLFYNYLTCFLPFFWVLLILNFTTIELLLLPVTGLTMLLMAFFLGMILAGLFFPVMRFLMNHFVLQVLLYVVVIVTCFTLYCIALFQVANIVLDSNFYMADFRAFIANLAVGARSWFLLFGPSVRLLHNRDAAMSAVYVCVAIILFAGGSFALLKFYAKRFRAQAEVDPAATGWKKRSKNKVRKPAFAIFMKDFKQIMRISNYSFSYLAIAVATPLVVLLCNFFLAGPAADQLGENILMIFTLTIILLFTSLTNSFSSSAVSREGKHFYITKIMPVRYSVQLFSKVFLNFITAFLLALISCVMVWLFGRVSLSDIAVIFACSILFSAANILDGLNRNIKRPSTGSNEFGEISTANTMATLRFNLVLIVVSLLIGWLTFAILAKWIINLILLSLICLYLGIEITLFAKRLKTYRQIEP